MKTTPEKEPKSPKKTKKEGVVSKLVKKVKDATSTEEKTKTPKAEPKAVTADAILKLPAQKKTVVKKVVAKAAVPPAVQGHQAAGQTIRVCQLRPRRFGLV